MSRTWYQRQNLRLQEYDYTKAGYYFVTVCIQGQQSILGGIKNGNVFLSQMGDVVLQAWFDLPQKFSNVYIHDFVIMPDHFHGIIEIKNVGAGSPRPVTLGQIIAYFKYQSTKEMNAIQDTPGKRIWQRNYYDRIIRNAREMKQTKQYIMDNPMNWNR